MKVEHILKFLKDLSRHNDREWFEKNKSRYLEAKAGFEEVVANVLGELVKFDGGLAGLNPKKLPFGAVLSLSKSSKSLKSFRNFFAVTIPLRSFAL